MIQLRWFAKPTYYRRDLGNLRLKPIPDNLTANGFWRDDDISHVRAIYNEVVLINEDDTERVEVNVYGIVAEEK